MVAGGNGNANNALVTGFIGFKDQFYAAIENGGTDGAEIWRIRRVSMEDVVGAGLFTISSEVMHLDDATRLQAYNVFLPMIIK